jgi:hypothetical protein
MTISPDVHILTTAELDSIRQHEYSRGVNRGKFEASYGTEPPPLFKVLADAMIKFAPDLAGELCARWAAATERADFALEELLKMLRRTDV